MSKTLWLAGIALALWTGASAQANFDPATAEKLARKSGCMKCHAMDKKKDGPALKDVAAKYKGKADAEATLYTHATTNPKVKIEDKEEEHASLKTSDEKEVRNVVRWILSL